jgi:class 3 adenylate cyclase
MGLLSEPWRLFVTVESARRRRAVILSADVNDDSRLLEGDETATLEVLTAHYDVTSTLITQHHGRLLNSPGDSILAEFAGAVDAVQGAVAIQKTLKARNAQLPEDHKMAFQIGIHLGDVIAESNRLYGDSVNVAVRLENLAGPGGICISNTVYDRIKDKVPFVYKNVDEKTLKNTSTPAAAYHVLMDTAELPHKKLREENADPKEKFVQIEDILGKAQRRRKNRSKTRLYRQLRNYLIVNSFLFIVNIVTYHGYWWIIWPAVGWGLVILLRLKRSGFPASDEYAIPETQALLQSIQAQTPKKDPRQIIIQFVPKDKDNSQADTVTIKIPVQVLKAGVKFSSFIPDHVKDQILEVLHTRGLDVDSSLNSEEIDLFLASLSGSTVVTERDDAKISINVVSEAETTSSDM